MAIKCKLDKGAYLPEKAHDTDAGFDLRTPVNAYIPPHGKLTIDTGVHVQIPRGYSGMVKSKSGLNVNNDIQSEGVVDTGYTGSVVVKLYNHGSSSYLFKKGDKISQLVITEIHPDNEMEEVEELEETERGDGGFGSTGR